MCATGSTIDEPPLLTALEHRGPGSPTTDGSMSCAAWIASERLWTPSYGILGPAP